MPERHALLSASSAHRWLHCPPSARLGAQFPDKGSPYAAAGTLAHAMAEWKARNYFLEPLGPRKYQARLRALRKSPDYDPAMDGATDLYLDYLKEQAMSFPQPPFVALENQVDYSAWAPEGFGTADCLLIGYGRLQVCDYKNGAGVPVEAEENPQMMLYALGALHVYRPIYGDSLQDIRLSIIQPHAGGVKEWSLTREELERWGEEVVRPAAQLAYTGGGDFAAGDWCRFCPAKAQCRERAKALLALEPGPEAPMLPEGSLSPEALAAAREAGQPLLKDEEIGPILARAEGLEQWVHDLKDYAFTALLAGRAIPGYKAVAGRSIRAWADLDNAFQQLQDRGVDGALLWEQKPVTVAGLEKLLGKKTFAQAAEGLVVTQPGKPTLAPEKDRRPPYNAAAVAFHGGQPDG